MPLYCYIIETGYYEDREANIIGHSTKYSQEEFDNICMEIIKKHGNVEREAYSDNLTLEEVEEDVYKIAGHKLIEHLVNEYDFIELELPVNDGYMVREVSRKPCNPENIRKVEFKGRACPNGMISDMEIEDITMEPDFRELPPLNCRCELPPIDLFKRYDKEYEKEVMEAAIKSILEWANKNMDYGKYPPQNKTVDDLLDNNSLNCSDMDRVPSNAEKIDEKTVRMKVKKGE